MQTYTYTPLNLDEPTFRLVRLFGGLGSQLQCEIVHALLTPGDVMDYEAVSYTWGRPVLSIFFIEVHGKTIQTLTISPNVYHMLLDLRNPGEDRMLWIDAICINQDAQDTTERNHQVQQMARIYGQAQRVVVWLGPSTHETSIAMGSFIEQQTLYNKMEFKPDESQAFVDLKDVQCSDNRDDPKHIGIKQIFDRPWFKRIWIIQEVANARRALIYCGKKAVSSAIFSSAPSLFNISLDPHCQSVLDLMPGSPARSKTPVPHRDLWTLLRQFRHAQAAIEHDNIYALLGLCSSENDSLRVSYEQPISTVISKVVSHICHYEITSTPRPLYLSMHEFKEDLDQLHERVLARLAQKGYTKSLQTIFEQRGNNINITEQVMMAAARNNIQGKELFDLMVHKVRESAVTDNLVAAVIENKLLCENLLELILPRVAKVTLTHSHIIYVIERIQSTKVLTDFLRRINKVCVNDEVLAAVINNDIKMRYYNSEYLLSQYQQPVTLSGEEIQKLAQIKRWQGRPGCSEATLLQFLLDNGATTQFDGRSVECVECVEKLLGKEYYVNCPAGASRMWSYFFNEFQDPEHARSTPGEGYVHGQAAYVGHLHKPIQVVEQRQPQSRMWLRRRLGMFFKR